MTRSLELIEAAETVAYNRRTSLTGMAEIAKIAVFFKHSVNWQINTGSPASARLLWEECIKRELDLDEIVSMTGEFILRTHLRNDELELAGRSISWVADSSVDDARKKQCSNVVEVTKVLKANLWMVFLFYLSASNIVQRFANVGVAEPKATKP